MAFRDMELREGPPRSDPLAAIARAVVLPVVREADAATALEVAAWLVEQGLDVIELTASTAGWEDAARELRGVEPQLALGVGTLRTREDAERAIALGADFLVTPCPAPDARGGAGRRGAAARRRYDAGGGPRGQRSRRGQALPGARRRPGAAALDPGIEPAGADRPDRRHRARRRPGLAGRRRLRGRRRQRVAPRPERRG